VHQGLLVINQVLDPRSSVFHFRLIYTGSGLKVDPAQVRAIIHIKPGYFVFDEVNNQRLQWAVIIKAHTQEPERTTGFLSLCPNTI